MSEGGGRGRRNLGAIKQVLLFSGGVIQALALRKGKECLPGRVWQDTLPPDMAWEPVFPRFSILHRLC